MELKNEKIEWFLKSLIFSLLLCSYCVYRAIVRINNLLSDFDFFELLHIVYTSAVALFFLIRTKPISVTMNPVHWLVALTTSFSGFFFIRQDNETSTILFYVGKALIIMAFIPGFSGALALGRSFGMLPALRKVKTKLVYRLIRHPVYMASIMSVLGYTFLNLFVFNVILLILIIFLYDLRSKCEEQILSQSDTYVDYMKKVRYRFLPGIY